MRGNGQRSQTGIVPNLNLWRAGIEFLFGQLEHEERERERERERIEQEKEKEREREKERSSDYSLSSGHDLPMSCDCCTGLQTLNPVKCCPARIGALQRYHSVVNAFCFNYQGRHFPKCVLGCARSERGKERGDWREKLAIGSEHPTVYVMRQRDTECVHIFALALEKQGEGEAEVGDPA